MVCPQDSHGQKAESRRGCLWGAGSNSIVRSKASRELEAAWEHEAHGGTLQAVPTFAEWWKTYDDTYTIQKARPEMDRTTVGYVLEKWKRLKLTQITKSMCERHLQVRLKTVSQGTVSREATSPSGAPTAI